MMVKRVPLDNVCEKKVATLSTQHDGLIDYVDISSVDNESKRIVGFQTLSAKDAPSRAKQLLEVGDILVSTVRPNLNAVAMVEKKEDNLLVGSTGYCVLRCKDAVDKRFIFYFCQSPYFVDDMTAQATGASYPAVTAGIVKNSCIPFRSIEEQREIANKLDSVSKLISMRKEQIAKLDELVKARFVELFGDVDYPSVALIDLISEGAGLSYGIVVPGDNTEDGIPMIRPSDFINDVLCLEKVYKVTPEIEKKYARTRLIGDEILVQVIGQPGQIMLSDSRCKGMNVTRNLAVVRPNHAKVNRIYLKTYMQTQDAQMFMLGETKQSTLKQLPLSRLKELPILLPPIALQEQFADFVEQSAKSKLTIQASLDKLEVMKKALMQEYFG